MTSRVWRMKRKWNGEWTEEWSVDRGVDGEWRMKSEEWESGEWRAEWRMREWKIEMESRVGSEIEIQVENGEWLVECGP